MIHSKKELYFAPKMTKKEFCKIISKNWTPMKLEKEMIPDFLKKLPKAKVVAMYGSGSMGATNPCADGNKDQGQIGGIDVYRVAEPKDGFKINKDWYAVFIDPDDQNKLYVIGPVKDNEHWINEIPDRLKPQTILTDPNSLKKK